MAITSGMRSVAVPGGTLAVEAVSGSSEPIVRFHGISRTSRLFDWLQEAAHICGVS
jgi:hypothetical protein